MLFDKLTLGTMKPTNRLLKQSFILLLLLVSSCESFNSQSTAPGITIYKTRGDYFDLVTVGLKDGLIVRRPSYSHDSYKFNFANNDTVYRYRVMLINGYVLDCESDKFTDVFLDISFKKHILMEQKLGRTTLSDSVILKHIIDKEPYIEFYRDESTPRIFDQFPGEVDTSLINQIIREGNIEQYFTRIK